MSKKIENIYDIATELFYHGSASDISEFYDLLNDQEEDEIKAFWNVLNINNAISQYQSKKKMSLSYLYDNVIESLTKEEVVDHKILLDLLKRMGRPELSRQQKVHLESLLHIETIKGFLNLSSDAVKKAFNYWYENIEPKSNFERELKKFDADDSYQHLNNLVEKLK